MELYLRNTFVLVIVTAFCGCTKTIENKPDRVIADNERILPYDDMENFILRVPFMENYISEKQTACIAGCPEDAESTVLDCGQYVYGTSRSDRFLRWIAFRIKKEWICCDRDAGVECRRSLILGNNKKNSIGIMNCSDEEYTFIDLSGQLERFPDNGNRCNTSEDAFGAGLVLNKELVKYAMPKIEKKVKDTVCENDEAWILMGSLYPLGEDVVENLPQCNGRIIPPGIYVIIATVDRERNEMIAWPYIYTLFAQNMEKENVFALPIFEKSTGIDFFPLINAVP